MRSGGTDAPGLARSGLCLKLLIEASKFRLGVLRSTVELSRLSGVTPAAGSGHCARHLTCAAESSGQFAVACAVGGCPNLSFGASRRSVAFLL